MTDSIAKEIHSAIRDGKTNLAISLLEKNKEQGILQFMSPFGTWLHDAASYGRLELVKYLLQVGVDMNLKGGVLGGNALNSAVSGGFIDVVDYLLKNAAEMDVSNSEYNPLFSAIYKGNLPIVKLLITHGIDFKYTYERNLNSKIDYIDAESFAIERGENKIAEYLHTKNTSKNR
ncbi:MAG: ankyrin repeat domain-containing protein [Methylophilaceae bacterium]